MSIASTYADFMASAPFLKLFVSAEPGAILTGTQRRFFRAWPNQTEVTVVGNHFIRRAPPMRLERPWPTGTRTCRQLAIGLSTLAPAALVDHWFALVRVVLWPLRGL